MKTDFFKDKKVTVMRIGLLGRGVGDTKYLAEAGAEILVVDSAPQEQMQASVDALAEYGNVSFKFGPYDFVDFKDADFVLVGAGAPIDEPVLVKCREAGVPLKQSAALFAELATIPVIGVTGTRGKSTVTHMIHHVLSVVTGEEVLLGGNIRGVSNLQLLKDVKEDSLAVMELDSWQLQGWGWSEMSPQIAVFTNFMEDHLNYYEQNGRSREEAMKIYFADKANIFKYQEESGTLITTPEIFKRAKSLENMSLGQEVVLIDGSEFPEDAHLSMPGEHNRINAALATAALKAVSLTEEEIFEGLASFSGVPGRMEYLGDHNGVSIYNDNNATTPQAAIAGLKAVGDETKRNVVLLAGGAYKEVDPAPLVEYINQYCRAVFLLLGTGTDRLAPLLDKTVAAGIHVEQVETMYGGIASSFSVAEPGDVLLFSPGFASFGMFVNEYDRNDQFVAAVNEVSK
ncbi:MAG: UDP-N-acetylmuramoyl-L-alanine--D-glutamate ligase [Patescibacteria group bacterium]